MKVGLFIPCFIDAIYPEVGIATMELLERLGVEVEYPFNQTCCGQPMANEGDQKDAAAAETNFVNNFKAYDYIVAPSGSCVSHVRFYMDAINQTDEVCQVRKNTYELVEFITDILKIDAFPWATFYHKIAIHNSCSAIRSLNIAKPSEVMGKHFDKTEDLLKKIEGLTIAPLDRPDECCGFGGTFCVTDEAISASMGKDKNADIVKQEAQYVVSTDMSCLMHMQGIAKRNKSSIRFLHVAQVLNNGPFVNEESLATV
jgi:L-lactate dehydrogenase complex protein LldE